MSLSRCHGLIPLALLLGLGFATPVRAADGVVDGAGLFSHDARNKADDAIDDIRRRTRKDLLIETVRELPEARLKDYRDLKTPADRVRFFHDLAEERARRAEVNGVYVLLCRAPAEVEPRRGFFRFLPRKWSESVEPQVIGRAVVVWPSDNNACFPAEDREKLDALFGDIKVAEHNQDKVLLEAVKFAGDELQANVRGAAPVDTFRWTDILWAAAALAGLWAVLGVFRARVVARQRTPAPVPGANQGLVVLYGTTAALWLFETYLAWRHRAATSPALPPAEAPSAAESPADGSMHPDDLRVLGRGAGPWMPEGTEATTGHDHP
jgi:hypothetical protein